MPYDTRAARAIDDQLLRAAPTVRRAWLLFSGASHMMYVGHSNYVSYLDFVTVLAEAYWGPPPSPSSNAAPS